MTSKALHVILVEDLGLTQSVLLRAFSLWKCVCIPVSTEAAAWNAIQGRAGKEQSMVLADWELDTLNVTTLFRKIRRIPEFNSLFLLGGVPRHTPDAIKNCVSAGADDIIGRPYDLDELRVRIDIIARIVSASMPPISFPR